jgi:ABC-type transport system involved in cytochrome bd biosynthesis fused ATPase/permease subunit
MQRSWPHIAPTEDSSIALLLGLLLVIVGGAYAVLLASSAGWVVCAGLGLVLLGAAVLVPLGRSARFLRVAVGAFGIAALVLAVGQATAG